MPNNPLEKIDLDKKPLLIIFDSHNLLYRSYFAVPKLHDRNNRPTNAIQGICSILLKFFQQYPDASYCIASDSKGGNFRHELYPEYKSHRKESEDDLIRQMEVMPDIYEAFGLKVMAKSGYEADDFIAALVKKLKNIYTILIVSSDKDLTQLLCEGIFMVDPTKEIFIDDNYVLEKFGVNPCQIKDYLSLVGDASDNIPGAKSVGPKTAIKILKYGTLDEIIKNPEIITDKKLQQTIINNLDRILLSEKLVRLADDIEIKPNLENMKLDLKVQAPLLQKIFGEYDLQVLQRRIEKMTKSITSVPIDQNSIVESEEFIFSKSIEKEIVQNGIFSLIFSENSYKVASENKIYHVESISNLKPFLESESTKKIVYDCFTLEKQLKKDGIELRAAFDLSILYYHLMGVKANTSVVDILYFMDMEELVPNLQNQKNNYLITYEELYKNGLNMVFQIQHIKFFEEDRKVYKILRAMEEEGILIDSSELYNLKIYFQRMLDKIMENIIESTGYEFNPLSPKQTSEILFDRLELKPTRKSKNEGVYSTNHDILEELAESGVEVAEKILNYRSIYKLKSSYCDSLAEDINPETGRIHTSFALNGATTGRILSSNPNLQNIPTKTDEGKKIRSCFIAKDGYQLVSADYSQIELRILAHIAGVKNLQTAFEKNEDIHTLTASQVFGIPLDAVDDFWRSKAKAINFGIIYGIGPFSLSKRLRISTSEADQIIKNYLACYSEINEYLEKTKAFVNKFGYVETIFGRRCHLRSSSSDRPLNYHEQLGLERAAINAPIQGSASDIIKLAMLEASSFIRDNASQAKLLLQIHDELIFEVLNDEVESFTISIRAIMEGVTKEIGLKLKVDISTAKNWA